MTDPSDLPDATFRLLAEAVPHIVWMAGLDGSASFLNQLGVEYSGLFGESNLGSSWVCLVHPDDAERVRCGWAAATAVGKPYQLDFRIRRVDGAYRWHACRGLPVRDEHGVIRRWFGTATDIDDARRAEDDLRVAQRESAETLTLLEMLLSKAPVGFGFVDREFRMVRLNETLAAMNGVAVADQVGRTVASIVPGLWPQIEPVYRSVFESGVAVLDIEVDGPPGDALLRGRHLTSYYPVSLDGEIIGLGILVRDVTDLRRSEEALRFQTQLLEAGGHPIVAVDLDRNVIYWNRAAEEAYGWTAAEALGRPSVDLIRREEVAGQREEMLEALLRGEAWSGEQLVTRRDGTELTVHITNRPVFGPDGQLIAVIGVSIDVTARLAADVVRQQLAAIVEGSGDAIFGATVDGTITSWNGAASRLFGFNAQEIIGQPLARYAPDDKLGEQEQIRRRLLAGGPHEQHETIRRRKDGSLVEVLITASSMTDPSGEVVGLSIIAHDITERRAEERALASSERQLADAQRVAHLGSFELDLARGQLTWSDEYHRILGVDLSETPTEAGFIGLVHEDDVAMVRRAWRDAIAEGIGFDLEVRIIRADSEERLLRARGVASVGADGAVSKVSGTIVDDTERAEAERIRQAAETRFEIGFEQAAIGSCIADLEGIPTRVNPTLCAILGRSSDELVGHRWTEFTHPDELPLGQLALARVAGGADSYQDERRYLRPDASVVWASCTVTLVRDESGVPQYFFTQLQDISARKQMEADLAHQAMHDALTGLPNRALLTDRLTQGLARLRRSAAHLGVMFLDIDHFKVVNDSLGHAHGDALLHLVANRIAGAIRPGDTVARFGGDEFVVVCDDVTTAEVQEIAERVLDAVAHPALISSQEVTVTASLGIAIAETDATPETLLRDSDIAMYRAKERGRARVELFDEKLRSIAERKRTTATALRHGLARNEFVVLYQPVVDLATGAMIGVEALVRWEHPDGHVVSPDDFIPVAEETGLIVPIGAWVLEQACAQLVTWQVDAPSMTVAVNLSVRQVLTGDITEVIAAVLARTGVRPADLCLELTESVFMEDVAYFERTLQGLRRLGIRLAIDDFGTGYSSLSYLKRFPVDAVKIDRSFVAGLGTSQNDPALVGAIIAMAEALALAVIAEGVETIDELTRLQVLGCRRAQGFYFAKPMTSREIDALIAASHRWDVS